MTKPDHKAAAKQAQYCIEKNYDNLAACYLELRALAKESIPILEASLKLWEGDARLWPTADKVIKPHLEALRSVMEE